MKDYGSVDANPVMEKVWAARAGLGYVGKHACFITPEFGSWVVLAVMVIDADVDEVAIGPTEERCGRCDLCVTSCPTGAIVADRVVDARACLSYQTIENEAVVPEPLRAAMPNLIFGSIGLVLFQAKIQNKELPKFAPKQWWSMLRSWWQGRQLQRSAA